MNHGIAHVKALVGRSETSAAPAEVTVQPTPSDFEPSDVEPLLNSVTAAPTLAPAPCLWCGRVDCSRRFDHARSHTAAESTWRELCGAR